MRHGWALGALLSVLPVTAAADEAPALRAVAQCEPVPEPGRVRCEVELRAGAGAIRWADVQVDRTPEFVVPLRGRTGPRDAVTHEDDLWRWGLGFVARSRGEGDVALRVRAVVCAGGHCAPVFVNTLARIAAGH